MFAVPPRETTYSTPNAKFYVVNYAHGAVSASRELNIEQWKVHITGAVQKPMSLGWRDILNRDSYDQISTLMCIDTLPGGDSLGTATWRGISLKKLLLDCGADQETARDVVFRGIDGYDDSIPFTRAMQDDVMLAFLEFGQPVSFGPMSQVAGTGPGTLAGTLAQENAEILAGIVIVQAYAPGAPVMYGGIPHIMDPRTSICSFGSAEQGLMAVAMCQMGHFYDLAVYVNVNLTDSKSLDVQAGMEKMGSEQKYLFC